MIIVTSNEDHQKKLTITEVLQKVNYEMTANL